MTRKGAKKVYVDVFDAWDDIPKGWWLEHYSIVFLLRVEGMKGVAIKHRITAAEMKLELMNENWEYYIAAAADVSQGAMELNQKIKSVIDNLPKLSVINRKRVISYWC